MDFETLIAPAFILSLVSFALSFWQTLRSFRSRIVPVLSIEYDGDTGWRIHNIGNGPALNVVVAQKNPSGSWFNPVRIPPMAKGSVFLLKWLGHVNTTGIGSTYEDHKGKSYTSTCGNDLVAIYQGRKLPKWSEGAVGRHWNQPPFLD